MNLDRPTAGRARLRLPTLRFDAARMERALGAILEYLTIVPASDDKGLLAGESGKLLFFWYLRKLHPDRVPEARIDDTIESIHGALGPAAASPSIAVGLAGIGATFEVLLQEQEDEYDGDFNEPTDRCIAQVLELAGRWNGELEYVQGLAGYAVYAARRARMGRGADLYARIVDRYEATAQDAGVGRISWSTPPASSYRLKSRGDASVMEFNLGLAHGVPGMVAALLPAVRIPDLAARAQRLTRGAVRWLLDQRQDPALHGSHFSYYANEPGTSRLGWCYGDLAMALTLARVATELADAQLLDVAVQIGRTAASRLDRGAAQVVDAALCHGSAGLALMFALLHAHTRDARILDAAQFWLDELLADFDRRGLRAFDTSQTQDGSAERSFVAIPGLLEGYAGIGLCLLGLAGVAPDWADLVLLG